MALTTDQGICIRQWDWSETSQTVSIFGRETGILRCVAKGSKRENARFSGGLEVCTRAEFIANLKPTEGMTLLTTWDLQETFPATRLRLSAFYAAMSMLAFIHHALHEHDPHPPLFEALLSALRDLEQPARERLAVLRLLWQVLSETGHRPEFHRDVLGQGDLEPAAAYAFSARLGGLMRDEPSPGAGVYRVRAETVALLRAVAGGAEISAMEGGAVERATKLLSLYFREVFACELPGFGEGR